MSKIFRSTKSSQLSAAPVNSAYLEDTPRGLRERDPQPRELAYRSNDGLEVTLFWRPGRDELTVCGSDHRSGVSFKIRPERHLALDVYYHPYCYVTSNDISYEDHRRAA
jgi:hypothetical protein